MKKKNKRKTRRTINLIIKTTYHVAIIPFIILLFISPDLAGRYLGKYILFGFLFYMSWTISGQESFFRESWKRKV